MKSFILLITAILLAVIFVPIGFVMGVVSAIGKKQLNTYLLNCAISIDKGANVVCTYLLNVTMAKPHSYLFGNPKETISSVLGKNLKANRLTRFGKIINWLLDKIEKNHSIISIDEKV